MSQQLYYCSLATASWAVHVPGQAEEEPQESDYLVSIRWDVTGGGMFQARDTNGNIHKQRYTRKQLVLMGFPKTFLRNVMGATDVRHMCIVLVLVHDC